jgi:hypothetical protein
MKQILLNNQEFKLSGNDLPMLIHGADGNGASLFSVSVVANLYAAGYKLLFTSGYHMARDEFKAQTGVGDEAVLVEKASDIEEAHTKSVVFVPRENVELFIQLVASLPDVVKRVIFLKNFDVFDESHFDAVRKLKNVVLAGDLDNCSYRSRILSETWQTRVYFSKPENSDVELPDLPKYAGYLTSTAHTGLVSFGQSANS